MNTYLAGPAKKIEVRQVNRPTETTASWLFFPCCHITLTVCIVLFGISSNHLCHTGPSTLPLFSVLDSFEGLEEEMVTLLTECEPLDERGCAGKSRKQVATRKEQTRKASARNSVTPTGDAREQEL